MNDATRVADGTVVAMKRVRRSECPYEVDIGRRLSSEPLASDVHNHCVRVLDVLRLPDDPDLELLVMPFLRPFNSPKFITIGECVDFFAQIFDVIQSLHIDYPLFTNNCFSTGYAIFAPAQNCSQVRLAFTMMSNH